MSWPSVSGPTDGAHPVVFAGKSIGQVADHFATIIRGLDKRIFLILFWVGLMAPHTAGEPPSSHDDHGVRLED